MKNHLLSIIKSFLLGLTLALSLSAQAQFYTNGDVKRYEPTPVEIVDTSRLEVIYEYWRRDTVIDEAKLDVDILQIGNHSSLYSSYGSYRCDSIYEALYPNGCTINEYGLISQHEQQHSNWTFKDFESGMLTDRVSASWEGYKYSEPIPDFNWEITEETGRRRGLQCHKALTDFRGRRWEVWYSEEIPISDGPWKFQGLPGLVVYAIDADHEQVFALCSVRNIVKPIGVSQDSAYKTSRERALKQVETTSLDKGAAFRMAGIFLKDENGEDSVEDLSGRRGFFAPLERE